MNDEQLAEMAKSKMVEMLDAGAGASDVFNAMTAVLIAGLTQTQGEIETARILHALADAVEDEHGTRNRLN